MDVDRLAFAAASSFASAAKVPFNCVRFLVAATAQLRSLGWCARSTRIFRRRQSRNTATPDAQRNSRSRASRARQEVASRAGGGLPPPSLDPSLGGLWTVR